MTKTTILYAGFDGQKQLTAWERARDRAYRKTRRLVQQMRRPLQIKSQAFIEKR